MKEKIILLVEDNPDDVQLTRHALLKNNITNQLVVASDGVEALDFLRRSEDTPALILLDIQLPTMDGYTVARELRKDPALRNIPIIAVTSYAMAGDREKSLAAGCNGYLEKPINPDTFVQQIQKHLRLSLQA